MNNTNDIITKKQRVFLGALENYKKNQTDFNLALYKQAKDDLKISVAHYVAKHPINKGINDVTACNFYNAKSVNGWADKLHSLTFEKSEEKTKRLDKAQGL